MKKLVFAALAVACCTGVRAQSWLPKNGNGPVKFKEADALYPKSQDTEPEELQQKGGDRKEKKEGANHLYNRWAWYWKQHLDKDGYMVPPVKSLREWLDYMDKVNSNAKAARTTIFPANWLFQGPSTTDGGYAGIGRLNVVAFDPVDSNTIYVGSPAGGTWKTGDGGLSWTVLYENLPTLGVADIKINPRNRNTVIVATGDGDAGDAYSSGIIISHDGGTSWSTTGLSWLPTDYNSARSLLINPVDTNSLMVATNNGIYKSFNSGVSWTNVSSGNYKQILYKPGDTSIVYGSMYTDTAAQIMRSTNGGRTWTPVTSFREAQRIALAVCPSSPSIVKALASENGSGLKGIYGSTDNGATFTPIFTDDTDCTNNLLCWDLGLPTTSCGGQGWYDLCIAINPANANEVTVGGVNTYFSNDGGLSWVIANTWWGGLPGVETVHADKHFLGYHPLTGALFETCDGGVYKNYGPVTESWIDLSNGLGITEFYRNAVANGVPHCIGGAQDNGTKMVDGGTSTDLTGGDGMQPLINYGDPANIFYCSYQNGSIDMTRDAGANYHSITASLGESGGWVTPYALHPSDTATLLLGYKNMYVSHDNGDSWTPMSPVFDSDAYIDVIAISPSNPNYVYTVHNDYSIWKSVINYTTNFGVTWDTIHIPFTNFISDLVVNPTNEKKIWVTVSGYSATDKVYQYNLATDTWINERGTLPNLPVNCIVIDTFSKSRYIGTDAAVFYRDTTMTDWMLYNANLPAVHVSDLNINYNLGEIWAATFGRGMWKSVKAEQPPPLAVTQFANDVINVAPNPSNGVFTITATGTMLKSGPVSIRIVAADGKTMVQQTGEFDAHNRLKISAQSLPSGFYICELSNAKTVSRTRLVIY